MTSITEPPRSSGRVISRFATLGGAPVVVTRHEEAGIVLMDCRWRCCGCGASDYGALESEACAKHEANKHAGECRSMPVSDGVDPSVGELAAVRAALDEGLADLATAVESLAANLERPRPSWLRRRFARREVPS